MGIPMLNINLFTLIGNIHGIAFILFKVVYSNTMLLKP